MDITNISKLPRSSQTISVVAAAVWFQSAAGTIRNFFRSAKL